MSQEYTYVYLHSTLCLLQARNKTISFCSLEATPPNHLAMNHNCGIILPMVLHSSFKVWP